jgi:hypothetical protein
MPFLFIVFFPKLLNPEAQVVTPLSFARNLIREPLA